MSMEPVVGGVGIPLRSTKLWLRFANAADLEFMSANGDGDLAGEVVRFPPKPGLIPEGDLRGTGAESTEPKSSSRLEGATDPTTRPNMPLRPPAAADRGLAKAEPPTALGWRDLKERPANSSIKSTSISKSLAFNAVLRRLPGSCSAGGAKGWLGHANPPLIGDRDVDGDMGGVEVPTILSIGEPRGLTAATAMSNADDIDRGESNAGIADPVDA